MSTLLPSGIVAFMMTDVESSTELWHREGSAMDDALASLDEQLQMTVRDLSGVVIKSRGEGDSHFAAFSRASDAVEAAVALQRSRDGVTWPKVRIAVHAGEAEPNDGDYLGALVNHTARLRGSAHGGQVVCSRVVADVARVDGVQMRSLGTHRLRDVPTPVEIFQAVAPGLRTDFPPLATVDATASVVMAIAVVDRIGSTKEMGGEGFHLSDWQTHLYRTFRAEADAHDGRFTRLLGDGCLVAFEDPRTAIAFAESLCGEPSLHVRAAVTAGVVEVIEGELTGRPLFEAFTNVKRASQGEVWLSPLVRDLVGEPSPN
jgi:class 3 adenylate cyclase